MLRVSVVSAQPQGRGRGARAPGQTAVPRVAGACGRVRAGGGAAGRGGGSARHTGWLPGTPRWAP